MGEKTPENVKLITSCMALCNESKLIFDSKTKTVLYIKIGVT